MEIREISFYRKFKCLAGDCPKTCCHGWVIPLSDDDLSRFFAEKGVLGLSLYLSESGSEPSVFNRFSGTCRFRTKKGLCSLQLKKGHAFIPEVCRDYPRFFRNYRLFEERLIDLSCIEGAKLFLDDPDRLSFDVYDGEAESGACITNDDAGFLKELEASRKEMLYVLKKTVSFSGLSRVLNAGLCYMDEAEKSFLEGRTDFFDRMSFETFLGQFDGFPLKTTVFPIDPLFFKGFIRSGLLSPALFYTSPDLYGLVKLYLVTEKRELKRPEDWYCLTENYFLENPEQSVKYSAYFSYYILGYYLRSYEDYSFRKNYAMGLLHLNMILLFDMLYKRKHGSLDREAQAMIISSYNKKAFYNEGVKKKMYEV
ncbi:MAG: flagellin lysine-N-methylase, partial [Lachnospiraceae bacterium]|nr:flagellin lysine-N-methylase [Lachnospiraceae bacterium]